MGEMRASILSKVATLRVTMWKLYDRFSTMHKEIVHFHGLQQDRKEFVKTLKNIEALISYVQE